MLQVGCIHSTITSLVRHTHTQQEHTLGIFPARSMNFLLNNWIWLECKQRKRDQTEPRPNTGPVFNANFKRACIINYELKQQIFKINSLRYRSGLFFLSFFSSLVVHETTACYELQEDELWFPINLTRVCAARRHFSDIRMRELVWRYKQGIFTLINLLGNLCIPS